MNLPEWLLIIPITVMIVQWVWIRRLTVKYHRMHNALSRASAAVAAHRLMIAELQQLIRDDEDLNKCFQAEIEGKEFERAREVVYEQATVEKGDPIPWIPKENPK